MSRFPLQFSAQDQQGKTIVGATVTVTLTGTTTTIVSYSASTGGTDDAGIYTTDEVGFVKLWVDEADYDALQYFRVTITDSKFKTTTLDDVIIFPATSADAAASSAAASAAAALVSENNAAADEVLTDADATATAADVVTTNADVVTTNADVVLTGLDVASTNADVVTTNADVVTTNADAVSTGDDATATAADAVSTAADVVTSAGQVGAVAFNYTFSDTTAMADPGAGIVRFNNATIASVTAIAFDATSADSGNPDISDFLVSMDDSTNTTHYGYITFKRADTPSLFIVFNITGVVVDNTGWLQFTVTHNDSNGSLTDADSLYFSFTRTGNVGGGGTMSNLVEDPTPQLGGDLDLNGKNIDFPTTVNISDCLDEDTMVSDSPTKICTQQSIKAYADTKIADVVDDTTPQLGGNLDVNGKDITSPDGTDLIDIVDGAIDIQTASTSRLDVSDSGVRLGAANARVTTVLDDDTMAADSATALVTQQSLKAYVDVGDITLGTEQASTSGTAIDFTGIPAGTKRIVIMLNNVSTDGSKTMLCQIGDAGGIETSNYKGASLQGGSSGSSTAGFLLTRTFGAGNGFDGAITLNLQDGSDFTWTSSHNMSNATVIDVGGGRKALSAELTQVRITTTAAPDDFDAGSINISYEGG